MIDNNIYKALEWCIYKRVPFCMFRTPDDRRIHFYSAPSLLKPDYVASEPDYGFFISPFNTTFKNNLWIPFELDADATYRQRMRLPENHYTDAPLINDSTDRQKYLTDVKALIDKISNDDDSLKKVVVSAVDVSYKYDIPTPDVVQNVFDNSDNLFASCFYHPQTGFWLGASPELLLSVNFKTDKFTTMALAGTSCDDSKYWSSKDLLEQSYVKYYITSNLVLLGLDFKIRESNDVDFGDLSHICTRFDGKLNGTNPYLVINMLNPTPAVLGFPPDEAIAEIMNIEQHERLCYSGYIGFRDKNKLRAYVNIRCANFMGSKYVIYAGGGITLGSNPEAEYQEIQNKIAAIKHKMLDD